MDKLADLPAADLPAYVEPMSLIAVNIQTTFMPSADMFPWHPHDDDPSYQNKECQVKKIQADESQFTSNIYPDSVFEDKVFADPMILMFPVTIFKQK